MASPSPVPWRVTGLATDDPVIQDRDGEYVTWIDAGPDAINAEFIVRAVNSHADLLHALKVVVGGHGLAHKCDLLGCVMCEANAAIEKAEGVSHAQ